MLEFRNTRLAVIEAKAWDQKVSEGLAQAKRYASLLALRFAYATNGRGIHAVDMRTGKENHNAIADALEELGRPGEINRAFASFQQYLYGADVA